MKIVEQNTSDIDNLRNMVINLNTNVATIISDNKHFSEKLDNVLDSLKRVSDHDYKIKQMDILYQDISSTISNLNSKIKEFDKKFMIMDEISKRRLGFWIYIANNWFKVLPTLALVIGGLAALLEWVYKMDPRV